MPKYAADTSVPSDRSRAEIEGTLHRYGATQFAYAWGESSALIGFVANGRQVRFTLVMPNPNDSSFTRTETGRPRTATAARAAYDQATRQRWRALALVIKAKLEAVDAGITVFEDEFLAHIVLPNGSTVGDTVRPGIEAAYLTGQVPPLLAIGGGPNA